MELLNGFIIILITRMLFLQMGKWSNGVVSALSDDKIFVSTMRNFDENSSTHICTRLVSYMMTQYVPYTEIYRESTDRPFYLSKPDFLWERRPFKTRINFKLQYFKKWLKREVCCEGYVKIGAACVPYCPQSCERGTCVEPNVCMCYAGYRMSNDTNGKESCVPVCANGCINGTCVDPDVCSCDEGYWMDSDGFTCRPICDSECEQNNGYCSEPYVCSCSRNYRKTGNDSGPFMCEPICEPACINGHCILPNVCKCADGYERNEYNSHFCEPKCEACVYGTCTAPGICSCHEGYRAVNTTTCEPICSKLCIMGTCVAPESCECFQDYKLSENSKYLCDPVCFMKWFCDKRMYEHREDKERSCRGLCTCDEGYRLDTAAMLPVNGLFIMSALTEKSDTLHEQYCVPICDFDCINGTCIAPNVCTCHEGYHPSWIESQSIPPDNSTARICVQQITAGCDSRSCGSNAICEASGICACNDGYTKNADDDCVPFCAQACCNGTCTHDDGFAPRNDGVHEPICEKGCQNGDCVGPNHCVCHDNFVRNTGSHLAEECIPACTRNCGHGTCIIDDEYSCECQFGWTGRDCDQPTMCAIMMNFNHSNVNRITIRNDTNNTIMQAHQNAPHCYQCDNFLSNESLCYIVESDETNMNSTVGCLLDLPCYMAPHYTTANNIAMIVWPFVVVAVLSVAASLTAIAYLIYRRHQEKKLIARTSTNLYVRESFATESLLSESVIYM